VKIGETFVRVTKGRRFLGFPKTVRPEQVSTNAANSSTVEILGKFQEKISGGINK
jgi:hypothetical protein